MAFAGALELALAIQDDSRFFFFFPFCFIVGGGIFPTLFNRLVTGHFQ